jgi:hypothetical protein
MYINKSHRQREQYEAFEKVREKNSYNEEINAENVSMGPIISTDRTSILCLQVYKSQIENIIKPMKRYQTEVESLNKSEITKELTK